MKPKNNVGEGGKNEDKESFSDESFWGLMSKLCTPTPCRPLFYFSFSSTVSQRKAARAFNPPIIRSINIYLL